MYVYVRAWVCVFVVVVVVVVGCVIIVVVVVVVGSSSSSLLVKRFVLSLLMVMVVLFRSECKIHMIKRSNPFAHGPNCTLILRFWVEFFFCYFCCC